MLVYIVFQNPFIFMYGLHKTVQVPAIIGTVILYGSSRHALFLHISVTHYTFLSLVREAREY